MQKKIEIYEIIWPTIYCVDVCWMYSICNFFPFNFEDTDVSRVIWLENYEVNSKTNDWTLLSYDIETIGARCPFLILMDLCPIIKDWGICFHIQSLHAKFKDNWRLYSSCNCHLQPMHCVDSCSNCHLNLHMDLIIFL